MKKAIGMKTMIKERMGNTKNKTILLGATNSQKPQNLALSGIFGNVMKEIHIPNLRGHAKNPKIRCIFRQIFGICKEAKLLRYLRGMKFSENSKSLAFQGLKELRSLQKTEVMEVF